MDQQSEIFKEYDLRGKYPGEINEKIAKKTASAFVDFLKNIGKNTIVVGKDKRPSSPKLANAIIDILLSQGINVVDLGTTLTPIFYFAVLRLKAAGGMMITASHNPNNVNGIKFVKSKAEPVSGLEIRPFFERISKTPLSQNTKDGEYRQLNLEDKYLEEMLGGIDLPKRTRFSYSFDTDGDRLMVKDKKGNAIPGDILGGIIGDYITKKGDVLVYDLRCSHSIPKYFKNKGVIAIPSRVGHFNIKNLMKAKRAVFGMEITGHYYFNKFHNIDAPLYALRILSERVDKNKEKLADLVKNFSQYCHSGVINLNTDDFEDISTKLKGKYSSGAQNELDGLTVEYSNWWFNIRPSKTENLVRLVIEAKTELLLKEKIKEVKNNIKR